MHPAIDAMNKPPMYIERMYSVSLLDHVPYAAHANNSQKLERMTLELMPYEDNKRSRSRGVVVS